MYDGTPIRYDETGSPIGIQYRTSEYAPGTFDYFFFEKNLQGDIVAVYNENGRKIGSYVYDAWGNFISSLNSSNTFLEDKIVDNYNPFHYRGYYYDKDLRWYYLQSRYYDPQWGRFINADGQLNSSLLGYNQFAYCYNNPIIGIDPCGTCFHHWKFWNDCEACRGKTVLQKVDTFFDDCSDAFYNFTQSTFKIAEDLIDSLVIDVAVGGGFGIGLEASGMSLNALTRGDIIALRKDSGKGSKLYLGQAYEEYVSVSGAHFVFEDGLREFYDLDGNLIDSSPVENHFAPVFGFGTSAYFVMGFTVNIGIDLEYFLE